MMKTEIVINPDYAHLRPYITSIAESGVGADARLIYRARNSVYAVDAGGAKLNVKDFRRPSFPNDYVYTHLRKSKAARSYLNAMCLLELGVDTPTPVAYIEKTEGGRLSNSYYISLQLDHIHDMRLWLDSPQAMQAVPALARFLYTLHCKGVWHKDFSPGNILFSEDAAAKDGYRFYLVDLNRMEFGVHDCGRQLRNLAVIYIESEEETARFARLYAEAAGLDSATTAATALRLLRRYKDSKRRRDRLKAIIKHK